MRKTKVYTLEIKDNQVFIYSRIDLKLIKVVNLRTVRQIYAKNDEINRIGNREEGFSVQVILKSNNRPVSLLPGLDLETVLYLEQEIERYLQIKDKHVKREVLKKDK